MTRQRWLLLLAAAASGAAGQTIALWGTSGLSFGAALACFAAGGWLLARLERPPPAGAPLPDARGWAPFIRPRRVWPLALAILLVAVAAAHTQWEVSLLRLTCHLTALAALVGFALAADRGLPPVPRQAWTAAEILALAGLAALALATRLWRLDALPPVVWDDEILYLHDAILLLGDEEWPSPLASGSWGAPYLHAYTIRAAVWLVGERDVALRLVSAIPGALTVPLLYLAVRELLDRRFAFFSAALLALSAWAMILSRHGYVWAINGFVEAAVILALARGLRGGRLLSFVLAGIALGIGVVYAYAAVLMPLVVVLFLVALAAANPAALRSRLPGVLLMVLAAATVALPRITVMAAQPDMRGYQLQALGARLESESHLDRIARQLGEVVQTFHRRADENELFVPAPMEPVLDPITAAALGLGFFWSLFAWRRRPVVALLPLTFLVMLLPPAIGVSSTEWATAWRACGVVPGLYGLAAVPFALAFQGARPISASALPALGLAPVLALVAFINLHAYFVRHPGKLAWFDGRNAQHTLAIDRILAAAPGERVLVNFDLESDHMRALARGRVDFEVFTWPDDDPLPPLELEARRTLVIAGSELFWEDDVSPGAFLVDLLEHYFPGGVREEVAAPNARPILALYSLAPAEIAAGWGLTAAPPLLAGAARHTGTLVVPAGDIWSVVPATTEAIEVYIDGERFTEGFLARGLHAIELRGGGEAAPPLAWSAGDGPTEAVPTAALLRRGLPRWGFEEIGEATAAHGAWRRWVPVLWHAAPGRVFGPEGEAPVEWRGEIALERGDYVFLLRCTARTSVWLDEALLYDDLVPWPGWHRVHAAVDTGWHRLRVAIEPPIESRDLQLFWIDAAGRPGLVGGPDSRW